MTVRKGRKERPPLNPESLRELALNYVGRFATTRSKLRVYLARKLRERGWDGGQAPDAQSIADDFARQGYVDDAAYALSKSRTLTARGYGERRVEQALRAAGIEEADGLSARTVARRGAVDAALRFAERRRIGPFATAPADPRARERALAAMVRAGHGFAIARAVVELAPGDAVDRERLAEVIGLTED